MSDPRSLMKNKTECHADDFFIVGIGASAGGLEAIEQFVKELDPQLGCAYFIVQHLSSQFKSFMPELLKKQTEMDVLVAEEGLEIQPNCVYLIPPNKLLTIEKHSMKLTDKENQHINYAINVFLASLAKEKKENAIAVILSGKGNDGYEGIKAIKSVGGHILVQEEGSAKYDEMPKNAIASGMVDYITEPRNMPAIIKRIVQANQLHYKDQTLKDIFHLIKKKSGIDFTQYKKNSVIRRIERRVALLQSKCNNFEEYKEYLLENPNEIQFLQDDLLIGVTHFFRDMAAFESLEKDVLPPLFRNKGEEEQIRVWVAGCSTGQEAYSIAMQLAHYKDKNNFKAEIKIFATDLDKDAITYASKGIYPNHIVQNLPKLYIEKYFIKVEEGYQISRDIRKMIVFAPHNIAKDSPFVNLDLITCRNMMIYFEIELQKKVLSLFHFALNTHGYLFLGPSETIGKLSNLFEPLNNKWKIFKSVNKDSWSIADTIKETKPMGIKFLPEQITLTPLSNGNKVEKVDAIYQSIVNHYLSPCILINEENHLIFSSESASVYLNVPAGQLDYDIFKMVPANLSVAISTALKKVREQKKEIQYTNVTLSLFDHAEPKSINLTVSPFYLNDHAYAIISFNENVSTPEDKTTFTYHPDQTLKQRLVDLEQELYNKEQTLQTTIEELETSYEELQSTNEELIAANEELQSTNEELQSVNEELINVNYEYEQKIKELTNLTDDMDNLLVNTNIGTLFLDEHCHIKRFTPEVLALVNVLDIDIGRPFHHITHRFRYDHLFEDINEVLLTHTKIERELQTLTGEWYSVRIIPYRTRENLTRGCVITFVDISEIKETNYQMIVNTFALNQSPSSILMTNPDGEITYINKKFEQFYGFKAEQVLGTHIEDFYVNHIKLKEFPVIWNRLSSGVTWEGENRISHPDREDQWEFVVFSPVVNENGKVIQFVRVSEDITEKKHAQYMLKKTEMHSVLGELAAGIAHEIRNPLTSLKGFLRIMDETELFNSEYASVMMSEFERIEAIISEMLILAKPEFNTFEEKYIEEIIKDVCLVLETQALLYNVQINTRVDGHIPLVRCIEKELKQVFINLIKNSIEAMDNGGEISIHISKTKSNMLLLRFIDNGKGIPEDRLSKIGEPFYTTKEKGTGLGLMMSYKMIQNHKGSMQFFSKIGEGTTVEIRLPLDPAIEFVI